MRSPGSRRDLVGGPSQTRSPEFQLLLRPPSSPEMPRTGPHQVSAWRYQIGPPVHCGPLGVLVRSRRWEAGDGHHHRGALSCIPEPSLWPGSSTEAPWPSSEVLTMALPFYRRGHPGQGGSSLVPNHTPCKLKLRPPRSRIPAPDPRSTANMVPSGLRHQLGNGKPGLALSPLSCWGTLESCSTSLSFWSKDR